MTEQHPGTSTPRGLAGSPFSVALFGTAILVFALLLYTVREIVNPYIAAAVCIVLLMPLRREVYARRLLWAVALVTISWVVYDVAAILTPFVLAFVFAFLFDPIVTRLSHRIPRWVSALIILLVILGAAIVAGMFLFPIVYAQLDDLLHSVIRFVKSVSAWYTQGGLSALLRRVNLPEEKVKSFLGDQIAPRIQLILEALVAAVFQFLASATFVVGQMVNIILMPILGFYLLIGFPGIRKGVKRWLSAFDAPTMVASALTDIDGIVSAFMRAQFLVAAITGTLAGVIFSVAGVPYAVLLGLVIAVLDVVPFIGLISNVFCSLLVVMLGPDPSLGKMIFVVAVLLGLNLLETNVIAPRIIGQRVGLHPVVIILAIFVFAHEFGIVGLLVAVPCSAVIAYLIRTWLEMRGRRIGEQG